MTHFLQGSAWQKLQESLGREAVHAEGAGWSYRAYLEHGKLGARLYAPYGPVVESDEALKEAVESLKGAAKKLKAAFIRVEPTGNFSEQVLKASGLVRVARKQPEHTQRVALQEPFEDVLKGMQSSNRSRFRNHHKKGMEISYTADPDAVEYLIDLLEEVSSRTGMHAHDSDYLRANARALMPLDAAKMYLVKLQDEVIAAALVFDGEDTRYYAHAAADNKHRSLNAGTVLVAGMMQDALEDGKKYFDLYGVVPPEVTDHEWSGFSNFKRSFGGEQVDYAGTWEAPVSKVRYSVVTLARKVFKNQL